MSTQTSSTGRVLAWYNLVLSHKMVVWILRLYFGLEWHALVATLVLSCVHHSMSSSISGVHLVSLNQFGLVLSRDYLVWDWIKLLDWPKLASCLLNIHVQIGRWERLSSVWLLGKSVCELSLPILTRSTSSSNQRSMGKENFTVCKSITLQLGLVDKQWFVF
jgi:hypothetical protein